MTTAHKPTWKAAYGLSDTVKGYVPTRSYSARDLPSYLKLKDRKIGQGTFQELKEKDFKAELLLKQAQNQRKKNGDLEIIETIQIQNHGVKRIVDKSEVDFIQEYEPAMKKKIKRPEQLDQEDHILDLGENPFPEDEDSAEFVKDDSESEKIQKKRVESDEEDDSDDSEELLREYEKIKEQREKEELQKREEKHKMSMANREAELLKGNPLIDSSYSLTKRWYEDTVFRNQARKIEEKKNFVNDYVRSDFHRKFMNRYVMR